MDKQLDWQDVVSVYSGKDGYCCCGCSGEHTYSSLHRALGQTRRGYEISDTEVSDREVKRIVDIFNREASDSDASDPEYISVTVGKRLYIAYLV